LVVKGETVGVLYVNYFDCHSFSQEDKSVLKMLANYAAVAIDNAHLVARLEHAQNNIADRERELVMTSMAMDFVHKINNLAGPIGPWVSLIRSEVKSTCPQNSIILQYLDNVYEGAEHMLKEAQEFRYPSSKIEMIDLEELVGSIVGQVELMTSAIVEFEFQEALPPVAAVEYQLSAAIYSVASNAVKAVSDRGEISVELKRDENKDGFAQLRFIDTGCGIPSDISSSIFELGTSYWSDGSGTGYGLWRARNIVRHIGGDLVAESIVDNGSSFIFSLPFAESEEIGDLEDCDG
jgi:signal transduction histidine kinase